MEEYFSAETLKQIDWVCQIATVIFGLLSLYGVRNKSLWGPIFGLISEPFWFGTTIINKQPGLFLLCIVYTLVWIETTRKWYKDDQEKLCENCKEPMDAS